MPLTSSQGPEALGWLRSNKSPFAFAGNRFDSTQAAVAFVEQVYAAGARRVFIPDDAIRADPAELRKHGGPYADAMVIELPEKGREALYRLFEQEAASEGYDDMKGDQSVIDGRYLYLWWD
jgi:hypothetical protein